ncbi:MAG: dolichol kinase [Thermoprotei archaeon]|jgi:dolichol kinase
MLLISSLLDNIILDIPITVILLIWVIFVVYYIARWTYNFAIMHGRTPHSATYFGRKVIHFLAGGLVAFLLPYFFKEPVLPLIMAIILSVGVYIPHKTGKLMYWFQDPENIYEVDFTIMWGIIVFFTWFIDPTFWLGVVPLLIMAWGDGITGIVRNFKYGRRVKGWEGSIAMLILSIIIGLKLGIAGITAAIIATLVERYERIDDNITVPLTSLFILIVAYYFAPNLLIGLW